jgi:hypothetical protein
MVKDNIGILEWAQGMRTPNIRLHRSSLVLAAERRGLPACIHCLLSQERKVQLHIQNSRQFLRMSLMPAPGLVRNAVCKQQTDTMHSSTTPAATPHQNPQPCTVVEHHLVFTCLKTAGGAAGWHKRA